MKNTRYFIQRLLVISLSFLTTAWAADANEQKQCDVVCGSLCHNYASGYYYVSSTGNCTITPNTASTPGNITCICYGPQGSSPVTLTKQATQVQAPKQKQASRTSSMNAKAACLEQVRACNLSKVAYASFCARCRQGNLPTNASKTIDGQTITCNSTTGCNPSTFTCSTPSSSCSAD